MRFPTVTTLVVSAVVLAGATGCSKDAPDTAASSAAPSASSPSATPSGFEATASAAQMKAAKSALCSVPIAGRNAAHGLGHVPRRLRAG